MYDVDVFAKNVTLQTAVRPGDAHSLGHVAGTNAQGRTTLAAAPHSCTSPGGLAEALAYLDAEILDLMAGCTPDELVTLFTIMEVCDDVFQTST